MTEQILRRMNSLTFTDNADPTSQQGRSLLPPGSAARRKSLNQFGGSALGSLAENGQSLQGQSASKMPNENFGGLNLGLGKSGTSSVGVNEASCVPSPRDLFGAGEGANANADNLNEMTMTISSCDAAMEISDDLKSVLDSAEKAALNRVSDESRSEKTPPEILNALSNTSGKFLKNGSAMKRTSSAGTNDELVDPTKLNFNASNGAQNLENDDTPSAFSQDKNNSTIERAFSATSMCHVGPLLDSLIVESVCPDSDEKKSTNSDGQSTLDKIDGDTNMNNSLTRMPNLSPSAQKTTEDPTASNIARLTRTASKSSRRLKALLSDVTSVGGPLNNSTNGTLNRSRSVSVGGSQNAGSSSKPLAGFPEKSPMSDISEGNSISFEMDMISPDDSTIENRISQDSNPPNGQNKLNTTNLSLLESQLDNSNNASLSNNLMQKRLTRSASNQSLSSCHSFTSFSVQNNSIVDKQAIDSKVVGGGSASNSSASTNNNSSGSSSSSSSATSNNSLPGTITTMPPPMLSYSGSQTSGSAASGHNNAFDSFYFESGKSMQRMGGENRRSLYGNNYRASPMCGNLPIPSASSGDGIVSF